MVLFLYKIPVKNLNFPVVLRLITGTAVRNSSQTLLFFVIDFARISCRCKSQQCQCLDPETCPSTYRSAAMFETVAMSWWSLLSSLRHFRLPETDYCWRQDDCAVWSWVLTRLLLARGRKMSLWQFTQNCYNLPNAPFWSGLGAYPAQGNSCQSFQQDLRNISNGQQKHIWIFYIIEGPSRP